MPGQAPLLSGNRFHLSAALRRVPHALASHASTSRQSCAWAGCGAMATASVAPASQPLPDPLRRATPRPRGITHCEFAARSKLSVQTRCRKPEHVRPARSACCARSRSRAGSRGHPPQAPVLYSRRSPPTRSFAQRGLRATGCAPGPHRNAAHGRVAARIKPRRPRWTVLRPSVATSAPARRISSDAYVSDSRLLFERSAAQRVLPRGRKTGRRGESGSSAMRCDGRRSHRAAARPCAALPRGRGNSSRSALSRPLTQSHQRLGAGSRADSGQQWGLTRHPWWRARHDGLRVKPAMTTTRTACCASCSSSRATAAAALRRRCAALPSSPAHR